MFLLPMTLTTVPTVLKVELVLEDAEVWTMTRTVLMATIVMRTVISVSRESVTLMTSVMDMTRFVMQTMTTASTVEELIVDQTMDVVKVVTTVLSIVNTPHLFVTKTPTLVDAQRMLTVSMDITVRITLASQSVRSTVSVTDIMPSVMWIHMKTVSIVLMIILSNKTSVQETNVAQDVPLTPTARTQPQCVRMAMYVVAMMTLTVPPETNVTLTSTNVRRFLMSARLRQKMLTVTQMSQDNVRLELLSTLSASIVTQLEHTTSANQDVPITMGWVNLNVPHHSQHVLMVLMSALRTQEQYF